VKVKKQEYARIIFAISIFIFFTVSEFDAIILRLFRGHIDVKQMLIALNVVKPLINFSGLFVWSVVLAGLVRYGKILSIFEGNRRTLLVFSILVFAIISSYTAYFILDGIPHFGDGGGYLFQARVFSKGMLSADVPPYRYLIDTGISYVGLGHIFSRTLVTEDRLYIHSAPGYPFFLALGILIDQSWIINPVFGVLFLIILYRLGKEIYGENTGLLAVFLAALSPFALIISASFFAHSSSLFFTSLFIYYLTKALKVPKNKHYLISGISIGIVFNIRPLTAVGVSFFPVLYLLYHSIKLKKLKGFLYFTAGLMFFLLVFLAYNGHQTGFTYFTIESQMFAIYGGGFGFQGTYFNPDIPHTPLKGLAKVNVTHQYLNQFIFHWPIPALFFVLVIFLSHKRNNWDLILLSSHIGLASAYFFWFSTGVGPGYGPRFQYESMCVLTLLTARGMQVFPFLLTKLRLPSPKQTAIVFITILILFNIASLPYFLYGFKNYRGYGRYIIDFIKDELELRKVEKAIILVHHPRWHYVGLNNLDLEGAIVYGIDLDEYYGIPGGTKELAHMYFPERECFKLKFTADDPSLVSC